jgi:type I restriction enzyme S subunit
MLDAVKNRGVLKQYLRNINVRWFGFDLSDLRSMRIPLEESDELSVRDGDLFICEGGEPGRCAVWRLGENDLVYQKALHRVRPVDGLTPEFLMYQLRHHADAGALRAAFTGTTIKHLTRQSLAGYEVGIPPKREQQRIADKLDAVLARVDVCRERLDRVPNILKRFRQAVLAAATSGELTEDWRRELSVADAKLGAYDGDLPQGWTWSCAEELRTNERHAFAIGPFGSNLKVSDYTAEGVPLVFVRDVRSKLFGGAGTKFVSSRKAEELHAHSISGGDLL